MKNEYNATITKYLLVNRDFCTWQGSRLETHSGKNSLSTAQHLTVQDYEQMGDSPLLAIMLNPWHAELELETARMLQISISGPEVENVGNRPGSVIAAHEVPQPDATTDQKIVFALLVLKEIYQEESFAAWADKWIDGTDRTIRGSQLVMTHLLNLVKENNELQARLAEAETDLPEKEIASSKIGSYDSNFAARCCDVIFAAQMYVNRAENWRLVAAYSVVRCVTGLESRIDFAAIAEQAVHRTFKTIPRVKSTSENVLRIANLPDVH